MNYRDFKFFYTDDFKVSPGLQTYVEKTYEFPTLKKTNKTMHTKSTPKFNVFVDEKELESEEERKEPLIKNVAKNEKLSKLINKLKKK